MGSFEKHPLLQVIRVRVRGTRRTVTVAPRVVVSRQVAEVHYLCNDLYLKNCGIDQYFATGGRGDDPFARTSATLLPGRLQPSPS